MEPSLHANRRLFVWAPSAALSFGVLSYLLWYSMVETQLERLIGSNAIGDLIAAQLFGSPLSFVLIALYGSRSPLTEGLSIAASYAFFGMLWTFWLCKRQYQSEMAVMGAYALAFVGTLIAVTVLGSTIKNAIFS